MPNDQLPQDPDSLARWEQLPQNKPSKEALPPVAGGMYWVFGLLIVFLIIVILGLLLGQPA